MSTDEAAGFHAWGDASLAAHGIVGDAVAVFCVGDALVIRADAGGEIKLPAGAIERLRLGFGETKSARYHIARVFLPGAAEPLVIKSRHSRAPGYTTTMRRYAHAVAEARGMAAVERGLTDKAARNTIVFGVVFALFFIGVTWFLWAAQAGSIGAIVFTGLMVGIALIFAWHAHTFERPQALKTLGEAEKHLT